MSYNRFLIPPKSFYKIWISHIDAWPLFAANAAGVILCGYAMYRKCFCNPNVTIKSGTVLDPFTTGSMGERQIKQIDEWRIWFESLMGGMAGVSSPVQDILINSLGEQLSSRARSWDRVDEDGVVHKDAYRAIVPWSNFQEMISIKETLDKEGLTCNEFIFDEKKEASPVSVDKKKVVMLLAKRVDLLDDQFKVLAVETGLFDGDFKGADEYFAKLRSIKDESDITPEVLEAIFAPKNFPVFNEESLVSDVLK